MLITLITLSDKLKNCHKSDKMIFTDFLIIENVFINETALSRFELS